MKPWQRTKGAVENKANDPLQMIVYMGVAFRANAPYWKMVGTKRPRVCQFRLRGARVEDWHVRIDAQGGAVVKGLHPEPNVSWSSRARDFVALMRGEGGEELVREGQVRIDGEIDLMTELFRAMQGAL